MTFPFSFWKNPPPSGPILPRVGPFASNPPQLISGLPDISFSADNVFTVAQNRGTPLTYKNFTINAGTQHPDQTTTASMFIWADVVTLPNSCCTPPAIDASGSPGIGGGCGVGGAGGAGGSGAGGGSAESSGDFPFPTPGGDAGSGIDGHTGNGGGGCCCHGCCSGAPGAGGRGFGVSDAAGFTYGDGGAGSNGTNPTSGFISPVGAGSPGGNGFGGAGGGGGALAAGTFGGGGGGGGGLIVIVCNELTGIGRINSIGGAGAGGDGNGGNGGGGVIWVAAKKYDGQTTPQTNICCCCAGIGTSRIFQINHDNTLGVESTFSSTWDNT